MPFMTNWKQRGILYCEDNAVAETTVDTTPRQITALDTKGIEQGLTVDTANNQIEIATAGDYQITASISFSAGSAGYSDTFTIEIYKNTSATNFKCSRKLGVSGDVGSAGVCGMITCAIGDKISLYQVSDDATSDMIVSNAQLIVTRLS